MAQFEASSLDQDVTYGEFIKIDKGKTVCHCFGKCTVPTIIFITFFNFDLCL